MATIKTRINITTEPEIEAALKNAAKRDKVPLATKAAQLLAIGLELEEDIALAAIADERSKMPGKSVAHDEFWSKWPI
ncbi:MAG: toxin-antitoxin system, antitoxin component [Patescibacteria group bacterium]